tara:strand:- start:15339 stop:16316 length:978 start_codon:yes stop_codon:yes gene_type:complete
MPGEDSFKYFDHVPYEIYSKKELEYYRLHVLEEEFLKVCVVLFENGIPKGRVGIYFNPNLNLIATLGAYECVDNERYWKLILNESIRVCKEEGISSIIGPMSGSTWNDYRFIDPTFNSKDMFFGEAYNSDAYPNHFKAFGFKKLAEFCSSIDTTTKFKGVAVEESKQRFLNKGITFRSIELETYQSELLKVHRFCNEAFSNNFLFTPISKERFLNKFIPLQKIIDSRLVLLAEYNDELVGVVFCFPDLYSKTKKRLVIKTLARKNGKKFEGIGKMLGFMAIKKARELGYQDIIHALMLKDNFSNHLSKNSMGKEYKNYSLFKIDI